VTGYTTLGSHSVVLVNSDTQDIALTLPYAGNHLGKKIFIKRVSDDNAIYLQAVESSIDDYGSLELSFFEDVVGVLSSTQVVASHEDRWSVLSQVGGLQEIAADNLLLHFKLDEQSGDTIIDSRHQLAGSVRDGAVLNTMTVDGIKSTSLSFYGSGNQIDFGNPSYTPTSSFSLAFWIKFSTTDGNEQKIFRHNDWNGGSHYGYSMKLNTSNEYIIFSGNGTPGGSAFAKVSNTYTDVLNWHHWVFNIDETTGTVSAFRDGVSVPMSDDSVIQGIAYAGGENLQISDVSAESFKGSLDDLRIYDRVLISSEINALFSSGNIESPL
jgi:hypothetical protein